MKMLPIIKIMKKIKRKDLALFAMMIPGVVYLIINNYIPMTGLFIAFKNVSPSSLVPDISL